MSWRVCWRTCKFLALDSEFLVLAAKIAGRWMLLLGLSAIDAGVPILYFLVPISPTRLQRLWCVKALWQG